MDLLYSRSFASAVGKITVQCSDRGVRTVRLGTERHVRTKRKGLRTHSAERVEANGQNAQGARWARQAVRELQEYLAGQRKEFAVQLDVDGTAFQKKVWGALRTIPYGETRSYGEIARQAGNPQAARAVGMANHDNPVAIIVPCHRVIASDGSLGGYAGGLQRKSHLLRLEQSHRGRRSD